MGADVVRGSSECNDTSTVTCVDTIPAHFSALRLRATWKWSDERYSLIHTLDDAWPC
jgi:hypothetical protein